VSRFGVYLRLGRVSNLPTVWTNVAAGIVLAGASPGVATYAGLAFALSLFYVGGMFLNDAFDREIDAHERPDRPIASGAIASWEVFAIGYSLLAAGVALVAWRAPRPAPIAAAVTLGATIVLYDLWHKGNPISPVLMGACRCLVYVTAALAVSHSLAFPVIVAAICLFAYLIGLTYAAKQERPASLQSVWPLAFLMVPLVHQRGGVFDGVVAAGVYLTLLVTVLAAVVLLRGTAPDRFPRAVAALIAAISLVDALAIARVGATTTALVATLGWPATLALQRYVRGT
jgi:4-hydroxybenzoate polyprenyltransferase